MSRLANYEKMGYVPTPPRVVERVAAMLSASGECHLLDPCCGQGEALAQLRDLIGYGTTFGVELDVARSERAGQVLGQVIGGSYEEVLISKDRNGAELLWLNPPYMPDEKEGGRLELTFLRETQEWLRPGGVMVYIIRQAHLTPQVSRNLSTWYDDVTVYRFPDEEYETYQQVVVLGVKRSSANRDDDTFVKLVRAGQATKLPALPPKPKVRYEIPVRELDASWRFRSKTVTAEEMQAESLAGGVWQRSEWLRWQLPAETIEERPLMPMRLGHLALFLAAGLMDNVELADDEQRLLVKGQTKKVEVDVTSEDDKAEGISRTVEEFRSSIHVVDLGTGQYKCIEAAGAITEFVDRWQEPLARAVMEAYPPVHELTLTDEESRVLGGLLRHKRLSGRRQTGLLPVQKQAAAAGAKAVKRHGSATLVMATGTGKTATSLGVARLLQQDYLRRRGMVA